jgi:hypothetical protein
LICHNIYVLLITDTKIQINISYTSFFIIFFCRLKLLQDLTADQDHRELYNSIRHCHTPAD